MTYFSILEQYSIIGDEPLSFLVRNGTGRFLFSIITVSYRQKKSPTTKKWIGLLHEGI